MATPDQVGGGGSGKGLLFGRFRGAPLLKDPAPHARAIEPGAAGGWKAGTPFAAGAEAIGAGRSAAALRAGAKAGPTRAARGPGPFACPRPGPVPAAEAGPLTTRAALGAVPRWGKAGAFATAGKTGPVTAGEAGPFAPTGETGAITARAKTRSLTPAAAEAGPLAGGAILPAEGGAAFLPRPAAGGTVGALAAAGGTKTTGTTGGPPTLTVGGSAAGAAIGTAVGRAAHGLEDRGNEAVSSR